jgi:ribosomal protein L11 methyltransferase
LTRYRQWRWPSPRGCFAARGACDIDPVAVETAHANARANRAGALVRIVQADGTNAPAIRAGAPYDLVLANIVLGPLKLLAKQVARLLAPRATVVLSGLLPEQANAALAAWRAVGLKARAPRHAGGLGHAHAAPLKPIAENGVSPSS